MVEDHGVHHDPIGLECESIMAQNRLICNPSRKKKLSSDLFDRTMFEIIRRICSVQPEFHDDRVFAGAVIIPSQTPFIEFKFAVKLPRRQI